MIQFKTPWLVSWTLLGRVIGYQKQLLVLLNYELQEVNLREVSFKDTIGPGARGIEPTGCTRQGATQQPTVTRRPCQ